MPDTSAMLPFANTLSYHLWCGPVESKHACLSNCCNSCTHLCDVVMLPTSPTTTLKSPLQMAKTGWCLCPSRALYLHGPLLPVGPSLLASQGCHRLREHSLSHLGSLHQLSTFKCSFALSETGLSLLISAAGPRLRMLHADCIEVVPADHHGPQQHAPGPGAAPGAASALAGPAAGAGGLAGGLAGSSGSGSGGGFGQLGPQLPALQVLQLRRITSVSPQLWQLAPSLTSLVVWGEASNTGLIRCGDEWQQIGWLHGKGRSCQHCTLFLHMLLVNDSSRLRALYMYQANGCWAQVLSATSVLYRFS